MAQKGRYIMRAFFSNEDMANLIKDIFNQNTFTVDLVDEVTQTRTESDIVSYLGINFATWWEHVQTAVEDDMDRGMGIRESWKRSIEKSIGKSFALIEQLDEETITAQDFSGATISGRVTFLIDANKISNLEYYLRYLKSKYTGNPINKSTFDGTQIIGYLTLGILTYDQGPAQYQNGESIVATINWKFNYLQVAGVYSDTKLEISLEGNVDAKYKEMPMIKITWQNMFTKEAVPTAARPDLAGMIVTAISLGTTISYYDWNDSVASELNELFWDLNAIEIDGTPQPVRDVNIPVYLRITKGTKKRVYKCVITDLQKVLVNNEFNISSITLNGWGKAGA